MKKSYLKSKNKCKVTFTCPDNSAQEAHLLGDFNDWDYEATPMKRGKSGFTAAVELEPGQSYQYRYFLDRSRWANDDKADEFTASPFPDAQNCVIHTPEAPAEQAPRKQARKSRR